MKLVVLLSQGDLVLKRLALKIAAFSVNNLTTNRIFIKRKPLRWMKRLEIVLFS